MFRFDNGKLPQAVKVGGSFYKIHTDFRFFLKLRADLQNNNASLTAFDYMYIDTPPASRLEGIRALCDLLNPVEELPRRTSNDTNEVVIDYDIDAPYIYAAFLEQYNIDLLDVKYLHWFKFMALLRGLHDTELNRIISARLYKPSGKNTEYDREAQKQYEAWRLPQPGDNEPDEALDDFLNKLKG